MCKTDFPFLFFYRCYRRRSQVDGYFCSLFSLCTQTFSACIYPIAVPYIKVMFAVYVLFSFSRITVVIFVLMMM